MVNIKDIENQIISYLQDKITSVKIEAYPDKPENYKLIHATGAILVHYAGSKFSDSVTDQWIYQNRNIHISIIILARSLRSNAGIYDLMDAVLNNLTGINIDGSGQMYPTNDEFISYEGGIWQYGMNFILPENNYEVN